MAAPPTWYGTGFGIPGYWPGGGGGYWPVGGYCAGGGYWPGGGGGYWPVGGYCAAAAGGGGAGRRCSSDLVLLWLWCRPAATAPIGPLAWEPPYATSAALEKTKKKKKDKKIIKVV